MDDSAMSANLDSGISLIVDDVNVMAMLTHVIHTQEYVTNVETIPQDPIVLYVLRDIMVTLD